MSFVPEALKTALADRYRIERQLGQGGMATVYLATDLKHEREVALKVLRPELGAVLGTERFLAEIKITARLDHPHILTLIDSGAEGGVLYYVLPLVRGESLRDKLNKEKQLGLEEALAITKQVASALDYAHRHGVVHRDIKPENILLQEGEAMLTDFGIALAVKEAGGNRLTETGLSLGTPQYMSPEQATGDRQLDARSDVYSLAAVLYEMLAGEPPVTGPNAQAMIAKLMTEQPTRLRVVRPSVPETVDTAVSRALDKVPADRFASAGDFAKALVLPETGMRPGAAVPAKGKPVAFAAGAVVLAAASLYLWQGRGGPEEAHVALRDRLQLTYTGRVQQPSISPDGKQLAYFMRSCVGSECGYGLYVQDVGATTTHEILSGVTGSYHIAWSEDRRHLIATMGWNGRSGSFLVPVLGGAPRFLTSGSAIFFAGGDSLYIGATGSDSTLIVRVAPLNGSARDSIVLKTVRVFGAGLFQVPGTSRFVALTVEGGQGLWRVIDRSGTVTDQLLNNCVCGGAVSSNALWMERAGRTTSEAIVRVPLDPETGRLGRQQDTVYSGTFSQTSVTADGSAVVVDDGYLAFAAVAGETATILKGTLPEPLLAASSRVWAAVSPDGQRLLVNRLVASTDGTSESRISVMPWGGGVEVPITPPGRLRTARWADSVSLAVITSTPTGIRAVVMDIRTSAVRQPLDLRDSVFADLAALPDGWVWIPTERDRIVVERNGNVLEIPRPAGMSLLHEATPSPDGRQLVFSGLVANDDSVRIYTIGVEGGEPTTWHTIPAGNTLERILLDGSVALVAWSSPESAELLHLTAPGKVKSLGPIQHDVTRVWLSDDLKRMSMTWREYRGDAWLYKVVRS
jgi:tRNA A-37 threonylcarbamoyl transferase component Bud32